MWVYLCYNLYHNYAVCTQNVYKWYNILTVENICRGPSSVPGLKSVFFCSVVSRYLIQPAIADSDLKIQTQLGTTEPMPLLYCMHCMCAEPNNSIVITRVKTAGAPSSFVLHCLLRCSAERLHSSLQLKTKSDKRAFCYPETVGTECNAHVAQLH